jgi:hypothetical protein
MPTKSKGSKSKRQTSADRHKVRRKIRENKRDLKKAAKAMRKSGLRIRPKKQREQAKLALKISNADVRKEQVLRSLLQSRELAREARLARRRAAKAGPDAEASGSDAEEVERVELEEGADAPVGKRDPTWMHPISEKELAKRERAERRAAFEEAEKTAESEGIRRFLLIAPGQDVGSAPLQLRKVITTQRGDVPLLLVTLDARCPVASVPWRVLEDVAIDALSVQLASDAVPTVARRVCFVMTRADLVPVQAVVRGAVALGNALRERLLSLDARVAQAVEFTCISWAYGVEASTAYVLRTLTCIADAARAVRTAEGAPAWALASSSMRGKIGCAVVGLPNTGKSVLAQALARLGGDSAVAIVPCRTIAEVTKGGAAAGFEFPGAKNLTLVTVADSAELRRAPICSGDILFHSASTADKLSEPEVVATVIGESFPLEDLCRAFAQTAAPSAQAFLVALGRVVIREKGFYAPLQDGTAASLAATRAGMRASRVVEAVGTAAPLMMHRAKAQQRDGRNALRAGARVFLREVCRGGALSWAVAPTAPPAGADAEKWMSQQLAAFAPPAQPKGRRRARDGEEEAADDSVARGLRTVASLQYVGSLFGASAGSIIPIEVPESFVAAHEDLTVAEAAE